MKQCINIIILMVSVLFAGCRTPSAVSLFDGKSLKGWECPDSVFRVKDGCIVAGSMETPLEHSYYLCTEGTYDDFELTLKAKFISKGPYENGGVSFRAERVQNSTQVAGYQADMGHIEAYIIPLFSDHSPSDSDSPYPLWGILVDEFRSNTSRYPNNDFAPVVFLDMPERSLIEHTIKKDDWNEIHIMAKGPQIEIQVNGIPTATFLEKETWVPREGHIGLQVHSGGPCKVLYKDIKLRQLQANTGSAAAP